VFNEIYQQTNYSEDAHFDF